MYTQNIDPNKFSEAKKIFIEKGNYLLYKINNIVSSKKNMENNLCSYVSNINNNGVCMTHEFYCESGKLIQNIIR